MHPTFIHHICPPGLHHVFTKATGPKEKKRQNKKKKHKRIRPLPCRTVLAQVPSFVPGPAFPRLVCPANTPSSLRKQQPGGLGVGSGVWCYLKRYSLAPGTAPWSPADSTCWAVKRGRPGPPLACTGTPSGGQQGPPDPLTEGPKCPNSPCSADLSTDALQNGTVDPRWAQRGQVSICGELLKMVNKKEINVGWHQSCLLRLSETTTELETDRFYLCWKREKKPFISLPALKEKTGTKNKKEPRLRTGFCVSEWAASIKCKQKRVPFCKYWCSVAGQPAFVGQGGEGCPHLVTFTPSADRAPLTVGHGC